MLFSLSSRRGEQNAVELSIHEKHWGLASLLLIHQVRWYWIYPLESVKWRKKHWHSHKKQVHLEIFQENQSVSSVVHRAVGFNWTLSSQTEKCPSLESTPLKNHKFILKPITINYRLEHKGLTNITKCPAHNPYKLTMKWTEVHSKFRTHVILCHGGCYQGSRCRKNRETNVSGDWTEWRVSL